jgi:23S rRNA (uridine2552-2'-O)-methyltransferase
MASKRAARSRAWTTRQEKDPYVREARARAYRSRAVFKLEQLDKKDSLFRRGMAVVDLGAAPGSWSQYAAQKVGPNGFVVALDRLDFPPIPGVFRIKGDFTDADIRQELDDALGAHQPDLVISDLAPNLSGVHSVDQAAIEDLVLAASRFAWSCLAPKGTFVAKIFEGSHAMGLRKEISSLFRSCQIRKPLASRSHSAEIYLVTRGPVRPTLSRLVP